MSTGRWATGTFPRGGAYIEMRVAPAAALGLAASAPRVATGVRVDAPAGALSLSAAAPRIAAGARIQAPSASLSLGAAAPRVATGIRVDAPAAAMTLAAVAPRVASGVRVVAPSAALALAAAAPSVGLMVRAPAAAMTLAAVAPRVAAGVRVDAPSAALALAAAAPSVGLMVRAPTAALALAASAPRVAAGVRVDAPSAAMSLAAAVPRVAAGVRIDAPAAALALAAPTPIVGLMVRAPSVGMGLAAAVPRVAVGIRVVAPAAAMVLDANPPTLGVIELTRPDIIYAAVLEASARGWGLVDRLPARGEGPPGYVEIERIYVSQSVYVATEPFVTGASDTPANTPFAGRLSALSLRRSIQAGERFGGVAEGDGVLAIDNADGRYDERLFQAVAGDVITIKAGTREQAFTNWRTIFKGTARDQEFDDRLLRLPIRDDSFRLDTPIQTHLYAGSGGAEGGDAIANKPKPLLLGRRANIEPVQVSSADLTYQIHDGALDDVFAVRDRGVALTFDADYADYAALVAATITAGRYATCLAEGFIRLETVPNGQVTADAATYRSTGAAPLSTVVRGALEDYGPITSFDEAGFTDMAAAYPGDHGIFVSENDNWTIRETVERLLSGCAAYVFFRRDGRCQIGRVRAPTGAALRVFGLRDIMGEVPHERLPPGLSPPPWRMRGLYAANNTVQTDLAGAADQIYRQPGKVAVAQDSDVLSDYALAQDLPPFDMGMTDGTEAGTEIARQLAIFKEPRPLRRVPLPRNALNAEIGDIVDVDYDRLGGRRRGINIEDAIAVGDGLDRVELLIYG